VRCSSFTGYNPPQVGWGSISSFLIFGSGRILSFRPWCRTRSLARIRERAGASNASGWPDRRSQHPSAAKKMSRLLRRQMLRRIEPMLSPQPSFTPPRPTTRAQCKAATSASPGEMGTGIAQCRRNARRAMVNLSPASNCCLGCTASSASPVERCPDPGPSGRRPLAG
jgi:hypothetical protein